MAKDMLDLHGVTKDEVPDLVDRFIVKANGLRLGRARIMTGKGKGIVQQEVIKYLKQGGFHFAFDKSPNGKPNEGVLVVFLE